MQGEQRARTIFLWTWTLVTALKLLVAARLPLFVDEAFYWQEGQHLAAAYSDLPGLTAWLARLGVELGGQHVLALRLPFLAIGAWLPWAISRIAARWFGEVAGWQAGSLTLIMPLSATLGLLAVPDVPMALAAVLCLDAGARLLRNVDAMASMRLALALAVGALSHYRFVGVIGVGLVALLMLPQGRRMLRDPRVWVALAIGVMAWLPLLAWNADNHDAGLRFQMVDRHPWAFQWSGLLFLLIQPMLVTPLLWLALCKVVLAGTRSGNTRAQWRYFGLVGGASTLMVFALGFFTDVERISFHWPLPGYFALLVGAPLVLGSWPRWLRRATWYTALVGLVLAFSYYAMASSPLLREQLAGYKYYPRNFAGWQPLADAVRTELAQMPADTKLIAGNFKVGAELGFVLGDGRIEVLPHPLNDKHGRSVQLGLWGLLHDGQRDGPRLLVLSPSDQRYRDLLAQYHRVCAQVGPLPAPKVVSQDHGFQRFLLFQLPAKRADGPCVTPAMAWLDAPAAHAVVKPGTLQVTGWAFKDGPGLARVEVLLDGRSVGDAGYGRDFDIRAAWQGTNDPNHPHVGFDLAVDTTRLAPGRHWLGLRLHGTDGSVETWQEQPFVVE